METNRTVIVVWAIVGLVLIGFIRLALMRRYAVRGTDEQETFKKLCALPRTHPFAGSILIALTVLQYAIAAILFIALGWQIFRRLL